MGIKSGFMLLTFVFFVLPLQANDHRHDQADLKETLFREVSSEHSPLSYTAARKALFQELFLGEDAKGYYVVGVYCQDKIYPFNGEHPNGRLPDHTFLNTEHTWPQSKASPRFSKGT